MKDHEEKKKKIRAKKEEDRERRKTTAGNFGKKKRGKEGREKGLHPKESKRKKKSASFGWGGVFGAQGKKIEDGKGEGGKMLV